MDVGLVQNPNDDVWYYGPYPGGLLSWLRIDQRGRVLSLQ
jgi:hypothetical protein